MYLSQYTTLLRRHEFITNNPYQVVVGFIYSTTTLPWSTNFKVRRRSGLSTQQVHFMTGGRAIVGGRQVAYQKSTTYNAHFLQQSRKWNNNFQIFYFTCRCSEILVPTSNVELIYPRCMCVYAFHYYYCHTHRLPWTFIYTPCVQCWLAWRICCTHGNNDICEGAYTLCQTPGGWQFYSEQRGCSCFSSKMQRRVSGL